MSKLPPCDHDGCPKERCVQNESVNNLRAIALRGPQTFTAEPRQTAFDAWWNKEMGTRMKGSKYIAKRAWDAALREMGCFDD